ncbi:hypothetical protein BV20DRAFT_1041718 [Pilatotrama ljubarskyi]|nr:hypothetical protein BV20DRAFT_1041718 [Pilatotrama ljubarskyi]
MSSRPKPRPRPRPRALPATAALTTDVPPASSPGPSSAVALTPPPPTLTATQAIEDEDALFLRNQTRTAQGWRRLNKLADEKDKKKRKAIASDSSDSERESGSSPHSRNRKMKRRPDKQDELPAWTRKRPDEIIISSDSDDDILAPKKDKKPSIDNDPDSPSKSKRRLRSRSRSLTPPPALPLYAIQRARDAINQIVGDVVREPSPTDFADESVDTVVLDDELAAIARRVREEARRHEGTPIPEGGGPETVKLRIVWTPHPLDPDRRQEVWGMVQKRHENFHQLCAEIADLASVRQENVVLSYDGKRVFPSSTPHSIGIWAEAELEACDKFTYQYLQENKRMRSVSAAPPGPTEIHDTSRRSPSRARSPSITELSDSGSGAASPGSDEDDKPADTFHLIVRSERTKGKDISLRVRPTTKCGAIVRAFLAKAGLESEYPANAPAAKARGRGKAVATKVPALSVDGDRMDPETEIGEADLEDGDQVEVVGL